MVRALKDTGWRRFVVWLVTGVAAFATVNAAPSPSSPTGDLSRVAQKLARFGVAEFPATFAGVAIDSTCDRLIVYRKVSRRFDAKVRDAFPAVVIRFVDVHKSRAELTALAARVASEMDFWLERGVRITEVAPDPKDSEVEIGVSSDLVTAQVAIAGRYGASRVDVRPQVPMVLLSAGFGAREKAYEAC